MTKIIFDTNIYRYASLGYEPLSQLIDEHFDEYEDIIMPSIIKAELLSIPKTQKDPAYKEIIDRYIGYSQEENNIIPLDDKIIKTASETRIAWKEKDGKKLPLPDAIIGATAVCKNAVLYSNNDKDFSYFVDEYGLKYKNPVDQQDLHRFLEDNNFIKKDIHSSHFQHKVESLDKEKTEEIAVKMFNMLTVGNKRNLMKFADKLKNK